MINLTKKAAQKMLEVIQEHAKPENEKTIGIRIGVMGGGCSGFQYLLEVTEKQESDDQILEIEGVKLFINSFSKQYIQGISIDYSESVMSKGFVFTNPNATGTCGCGTSFSV